MDPPRKWRVGIAESARKQLEKLDKPVQQRVLRFLNQRLASAADPRSLGAPLHGPRFGELWKYRVGDYRLIARVDYDVVLVLRIGHRREVYR